MALTTLWVNIPRRHLTTLSESSLESPSSESPGECVKPCAISWELMYCRLDVELDSDEASEKGDPKPEKDISKAQ